MNPVLIGGRAVGPGRPCYVIAEIGSNHDGSLRQALSLIAVAAKAGADAVKFQSIRYDQIFVPGLETPAHRRFFKRLELPETWYARLKRACDDHGVHFLSCPTYDSAVELLSRAGVPAFKIASPQTRANLPLVRLAARRGKPLLMSTGYCSYGHIAKAVAACRKAGNNRIVLLHCVSEYPAPPAKVNLRVIGTLGRMFGLPAGLSDHTLGTTAAVAAVALGACVIEKHLTLDRGLPGPDHRFAAEPEEFADLVRSIRRTEAMLGSGIKRGPTPEEERAARSLQLRLIAARDLRPGVILRAGDFIARRHGKGLTPEDSTRVFGSALRAALPRGKPLLERHLRRP